MADQDPLPDAAFAWRVDTELRMIVDAVELVRSGASARVTLGGLQFGDQLLIRARNLAASAGLRVVPVYATDETAGTDLIIERPPVPAEGAR
jgi:hypothetical protein